MRHNLVCLLCITSIAVFAADQKKSRPESQAPGLALLSEARGILENVSPEEHVDALLEIANAYGVLDKSQVEPTAVELLYMAHQKLSAGPYQAAMEKNALTTLALVNPFRAANLYRIQELPSEDPKTSEDRRAFGARILFAKLWEAKEMGALPQIESLANWLGETGQYPYAAMTPVIQNVCKMDSVTAQQLFQDALSALPRDPGFPTTNRQFVMFLLGTHSCIFTPAMRNGVQEALDAIDKQRSNKTISMKFQASSKSGTVSFNSESDYLLYRVLPLIESIDPELAKTVVEENANLQGVPETPMDSAVVTAGAVSFNASPNPQAMQSALNEGRLMHLAELAKTDPNSALRSAAMISDPAVRDVALAKLLPEFSKIEPESASKWETDVPNRLDSMPNNTTKLQLLVALGCQTSRADKAAKAARRYADQALDFGTELFNQDLRSNPGKMTYQVNGFDELTELAHCYGNNLSDADWMDSRIEQVGNQLLRARLLIELAKGPAMAKPRPEDQQATPARST